MDPTPALPPVLPPRSPWRQRPSIGAAWAVAAGIALLTAAKWLDAPRVEYLAAAMLATIAAFVLAARLRGAERAWALAYAVVMTVLCAVAARTQYQLGRLKNEWPVWQGEVAARGLLSLQRALDDAAGEATNAALAALDAPADRDAAFRYLDDVSLGSADGERGLVLYRGDSAFAWAGRTRISPDSLRESIGIAASSFYLTLYASASREGQRAVATVLLSAAPPADGLSDPLAPRVARRAGLEDFSFIAPADVAQTAGGPALRYQVGGKHLLTVRPAPLVTGQVLQRLGERFRIQVGLLLAIAAACFVIGAWRGTRTISWRLVPLGVTLLCVALVPLNEFSNLTRLFTAEVYFTPLGGTLTANAGALGIVSAVMLLALLTLLRRGRRWSRWTGTLIVLLVAGLGPFLLRDLARGIHPPSYGVSVTLWLIWEIPLFLAAVAVLLAGAGAGGFVLGRSRGLPAAAAPAIAAAAAFAGPLVWQAQGRWPWWYTFLWVAAIAALALSRQTRFVITSAATVAALGATTLVWGRTARERVALAERDLASLTAPDPTMRALLEHFGAELQAEPAPTTRASLLQRFVTSELAAAGYPTAIFAWPTDSGAAAELRTASFAIPMDAVAQGAAEARKSDAPILRALPASPAVQTMLAVRGAPTTDEGTSSGVTVIVTAPKTRLIPSDPFARLLGLELETGGEPLYTLQLSPLDSTRRPHDLGERPRWERRASALHGDWLVPTGTGLAHAHAEVELRPITALLQRGVLIVLLDLAIVGLLWTLSAVADGGFLRWLRAQRRTWGRSYRLRLTLALFAFFVIPALAFAVWSYQEISTEAVRSRDLLVRQTLRAAAPADTSFSWISQEGRRLETPLLAYAGGELHDASDPLYTQLASVGDGLFLQQDIVRLLLVGDEETASELLPVGPSTTLFGFRAIERPNVPDFVLAAPAQEDELALERRRRDLGVLVLFATAVGGLAALWLSGIAARQLARPIRTLREAALSIAGGNAMPKLESRPTVEFDPVFAAFRRMATDLHASRSALEESQRRTAAVLRNVASGVVAIDTAGQVVLANPRADVMLDVPLPPGTALASAVPPELWRIIARFLAEAVEDEEFELEKQSEEGAAAQQLRGRLTRLTRGGAVLTLDDVTDLARAQRVLAWGEMARQVAHEIKNPLTPIRLGVQHLRRARADSRVDFDRVLDQNVNRILAEIDRLDEIARAFSRYGSVPSERAPAITTDVAAVVRDVVGLESMAGNGAEAHDDVRWVVAGAETPVLALARADELREVLLNLFENARLAHAREVVVNVEQDGRGADSAAVQITVRDNGVGIPEHVLPRIFEPHFSTRTSGSGLGLALSRQIIDGWGGEIAVTSREGSGTTVRIVLRNAA